MAFDWSINGYSSLCVLVWLVVDYTLRALICLSVMHVWLLFSFMILTCWLHRLILLLALAYDSSYCMIILLSLTCIFSFLYILFILVWLILFIVYYLVIYLSCLSCFLLSLFVDMSDIHVICMIAWCMTAILLCDALYCLSVWDTHLSFYLQLPSLGQPCFPWSCIWYETCCFVCSSIELVIRSRV